MLSGRLSASFAGAGQFQLSIRCAEPLQNLARHAARTATVGVDDDVGDLRVQRVADSEEIGQDLLAVLGLEKRSFTVPAGAVELLAHGGLEVDHTAHRGEQSTVLCANHRATAGRQNHPRGLRHLGDDRRLAFAESGLTLDVENPGYGCTGPLLDERIRIAENKTEPPGQQAAYGAFARAHRADEHHIARLLHAAAGVS